MFDQIGSFCYQSARVCKKLSGLTSLSRMGKIVAHNMLFKSVSKIDNLFRDNMNSRGWDI